MTPFETITELLSLILSADPMDMDASYPLTMDNGVAPVDIARLAIACEETFGIPLYDEKIAQWKTLGDACLHLERLLEEGLAEPIERSDEERTAWYYE